MSLKYFRNKTDTSNLNLSDWQPKYVYVLCRHIIDILFFTFFLKKLRLVLVGQSSRILIQLLFLFYSLKMTKLGRNVTKKYGQVFPQVNCPFYCIFIFKCKVYIFLVKFSF